MACQKQPEVDCINGNQNIFKNIVSDCSRQDYSLCGLFVPCIFPSTYLWLDLFPAHFLWNGKQSKAREIKCNEVQILPFGYL